MKEAENGDSSACDGFYYRMLGHVLFPLGNLHRLLGAIKGVTVRAPSSAPITLPTTLYYDMSEDRSAKFPLQGLTDDGWSNEDEATATCACGAVQMVIVIASLDLNRQEQR
jgi:hypothetical protein